MKTDTQTADDWAQANQRNLMAELARLGCLLRREPGEETPATDPSSALDALSTLFGLTSFERRIVLLCAGMELDGDFANSCAAALGSGGNPWPSFGLALAAFPDAHWDALANNAPLRRWRIIEICGDGPLAHSRLRIDERILFFLTGVWQLDARLTNLVEPLRESRRSPNRNGWFSIDWRVRGNRRLPAGLRYRRYSFAARMRERSAVLRTLWRRA